MPLSRKEEEILIFAENRINNDVRKIFMKELHRNDRAYENRPSRLLSDATLDDEIVLLIESYVSDTIHQIIRSNKNDE